MKQIEDILDRALTSLKKHSTPENAVLSSLPHGPELTRLVSVAKSISEMPKKQIPEPAMRRKYILAPVKRRVWFSWIHISRLAAASMSILMLFAGTAGTVYGAMKSLPGQVLFPVRKTAERLQLKMTADPVKRANLQVAIAQKRLVDAEKVFSKSEQDPEMEIAALTELSNQTKATVDSVQSVAETEKIKEVDHPLVSSLETLTKEQQSLLNGLKPEGELKAVASSAKQTSENSATKLDKIKENIAIASSNLDSSLVSLNQHDGSTLLIGVILKLENSKLVVQNATVTMTSSTKVTNSSGSPDSLSLYDKVKITAEPNNQNAFTAKTITILDAAKKPADAKGEVKGEATSTPAQATTTPTAEKTPASTTQDSTILIPTTSDDTLRNSAPKAVGSFIIEDPSPQFTPTSTP